jgi:pimeloyl-ACP methyl ester carboxylesterase
MAHTIAHTMAHKGNQMATDSQAETPLPTSSGAGWRRARRVLLTGALFLLLLAGAGLIYQGAASAWDASSYPPRGKLVDVGGYRLSLYCTGASQPGSPTVILEEGIGSTSLEWSAVQPGVAAFTRVCSYDRAGYGWSDSGPLPRTDRREVTELHTLLANAGVSAPYVLVGQSSGGLIARLYTYTYPEQVAGLVLVDSSHEDQDRYPELRPTGANLLPLCEAVSPFGVLRAVGYLDGSVATYPSATRPTAKAQVYQTRYCQTMSDEESAWDESLAEVRAARRPLGALPLVVLTRGVNGPSYQENSGKPIPPSWLALQKDLASLSTNSAQVIATRSGHAIQLDQPDLVVAAIRQVLTGQVRRA